MVGISFNICGELGCYLFGAQGCRFMKFVKWMGSLVAHWKLDLIFLPPYCLSFFFLPIFTCAVLQCLFFLLAHCDVHVIIQVDVEFFLLYFFSFFFSVTFVPVLQYLFFSLAH